MNNEYVIINKSLIEKRIEELEKERVLHEKVDIGMFDSIWAAKTSQAIDLLIEVLSLSTPLIPEINAAIEFGKDIRGSNTIISTDENGTRFIDYFDTTIETNHYISNLKLDI